MTIKQKSQARGKCKITDAFEKSRREWPIAGYRGDKIKQSKTNKELTTNR